MNKKLAGLMQSPTVRRLSRVPMTLYLLAAMVLVFSLMTEKYLRVSNVMNIIVQTSSGIGIVALASFMAICSTGVDLSLGGIVSLAGMVTARLLTGGEPMLQALRGMGQAPILIFAIAIGILTGMAVGAVNGLILSRTNIPSFIVTLGTYKICETLSRVVSGGSTIRVNDMDAFEMIGGGSLIYAQFGRRMVGLLPVCTLIMLALYVIFHIIMRRTRFGTYVYAIGGNYDAAMLSGIPVEKVRFKVFLLNGMIAAIAGVILTSRLTAASAANGLGLEFDGIAAAVVGGVSMTGGKSTPLRTLIGAFTIFAMKNGFNMIGMSNSVQMITIGAVLIVIVAIDAIRNKR